MFKFFFKTLVPLLGCLGIGCQAVPPLSKVDFNEPGWQVLQGQAVWRLASGGREIAGDVLVATKGAARSFVQFSKSPFPLVIAQATADHWQIEFPPQNRHYAGRGTPPKRLIWLYLARVLSDEPPPKNWTWQQDASGWRLENRATGESLEGFFSQ